MERNPVNSQSTNGSNRNSRVKIPGGEGGHPMPYGEGHARWRRGPMPYGDCENANTSLIATWQTPMPPGAMGKMPMPTVKEGGPMLTMAAVKASSQ